MKKVLAVILSFFLFLFCFSSKSLATNLSRVTGRALEVNTNKYLDFTNYNSNVKVDNSSGNFQGYGFLESIGWCDFGTQDNASGPVNVNISTGAVTGKAYCLNTQKYIDFTNYNANVVMDVSARSFSGFAFSEDIGWLNFSNPGVSLGALIDLEFISVIGNTTETIPTLTFKKAQNVPGGVSSYTVSLDSGKNRSFSQAGIPASGNGSALYTWRDNSEVKIEFTNENDTDASNDEIKVYFKALDTGSLSEGKHSWKVKVYGNQGDEAEFSHDFYIDLTQPEIEELILGENEEFISKEGEYTLNILHRMPTFVGWALDSYQGSETENSNGTKDTFDKVASGPEKLTLTINKKGSDYSLYAEKEFYLTDLKDEKDQQKSKQFSVQPPFPLTDGYYQVVLGLEDQAGNKYELESFYLRMNYFNLFTGLGGVWGQKTMETEIIEIEEIPAETEEEKEKVKEQGYQVTVQVVDKKEKPLEGVKVELHSEVREALTNEQGLASFSNVEEGEHTLKLAYKSYQAEQKINLEGEVKEFKFTIQVNFVNPFLKPLNIILISILVLVIAYLLYKLQQAKFSKKD